MSYSRSASWISTISPVAAARPARTRDPCPGGRFLQDELHARSVAVTEHHLPRTIAGIAFDDQDFDTGAGNLLRQKRIQRFPDGAGLIERRYE